MLTNNQYTLRPYQQKAVDAALEGLATKKNGIIVLPTGSGKSLVIASIAQHAGGRTIILQPTKEILEQNRGKMAAFGIYDTGVYSASCGQKNIRDITFATIGSVIKHKDLFESFDRIIVDECHLTNAKGGMYEEFISHLKLPTIGLTATPYRLRHYENQLSGVLVAESRILTRTRPRIFSRFLHITQVKELFDAGYLCPLDYDWKNDYDTTKIKTNSTGQGYDDGSLKHYNRIKGIPGKIVNAVVNSTAKHCLAFTQFRDETAAVIDGLRERGITCAEVAGTTKKREREGILREFQLGHIRCVVNVGVLTTGFDFPELDCIIIGRPTRSVALYYQMTGRGIRIAPDKPGCKLIDLCGNVKRFGGIESFELYDANGNQMWRLRSNVGNLTGVNIINGEDLERNKPMRKSTGTGPTVTFGKHAGTPLSEIPDGYLVYCVDKFDDGKWKNVFAQELLRRDNHNFTGVVNG